MAIGLSVHTAPVEIREKLAIAEADWPKAIGELCAFPHVEEAAVLSTCNRMEVYIVALSYNRGVREVEEFLARVRRGCSCRGHEPYRRRRTARAPRRELGEGSEATSGACSRARSACRGPAALLCCAA